MRCVILVGMAASLGAALRLAPAELAAKTTLLSFARRSTSSTVKEDALSALMQANDRDDQLDAALSVIDAYSRSAFARTRWPLPMPSRRAALGTYNRLLNSMASQDSSTSDGVVAAAARRRFLLVLLRQLSSQKGVWALETEALRRERLTASMDEMLARTPDLETPAYEVISQRGVWEVRRYEEFSVASTARNREVSTDGIQLQASSMRGAGGFQALAGYIFGRNQKGEKMSMTTPVFTRGESSEMSFGASARHHAAPSTLCSQSLVAPSSDRRASIAFLRLLRSSRCWLQSCLRDTGRRMARRHRARLTTA